MPLPFAGCDFDFNATAIWGVLSYVSSPSPSEVLLLKAEMNRIYNTLWAANWSWSRDDEFDASTNTGTYKLGTFMGIADNGAHNSVAPYADPAAPWDGLDPLGAADEEEVALLRAFNRSFPEYWCHRDRMGVPELNQLRRKCQGLGSYSTLDADAKEASCQVCEEFSARHIRIGCSETDDTYTDVTIDRQPVCGLVGDPADADFLYLDLDPTVPEANDAALAATEFCRSNAPSYGPCVDLFLFGDYDTAFCSVVYWPFYQCLGCGSCLPVGSYMTIIDSPYEEADLNWTWSFWGGYPSDVNDLSGSFVYDVLTPYYCGVTVTGNAGLSIEVWDPYYASSSTAFDTATSSCFGG